MTRIDEVMQAAREGQSPAEPLIASSCSTAFGNTVVETVGASVPRRGKGEGLVFTMKVQVNRDRVGERYGQDKIDETTKYIHEQLSLRLAELVGGRRKS